MRTLIIDGDGICWPASFANNGPRSAENRIYRLMNELAATRAIVAFGSEDHSSFRRAMFPDYKKSRKDRPRPAQIDEIAAHLKQQFICRELPNLEADDILGILATCGVLSGECVMVHNDKDLLGVPGLHHQLDLKKMAVGEVREINEEQALYHHMTQTLTGDTGDDYPGCPKIGPVNAKKILAHGGPSDWWRLVENAFLSRGIDREGALLQARLAKILTAREYDFEKKEIRLWQPPPPVIGTSQLQPQDQQPQQSVA